MYLLYILMRSPVVLELSLVFFRVISAPFFEAQGSEDDIADVHCHGSIDSAYFPVTFFAFDPAGVFLVSFWMNLQPKKYFRHPEKCPACLQGLG
jgi:hypothetical protein